MTEKLREAARQALEALCRWSSGLDVDAVALNDLIDELDAALAEQTVPSDCADSHQPVAWMVYTADGKSVCVTDHPADFVQWRSLPLYTAPPQRPSLTDEEIEHLSRTMVGGNKSVQWLARIIERKVRGEKE